MTEFEFFEEQILNYINGNISDTRQNIKDSNYSFSGFLDHYVEQYDPSQYELILFVKRILMPYVE